MPSLTHSKIFHQIAYLRVAFGVVWLIDAILKWQPAFLNGFLNDVTAVAQGQPSWLGWWFNFWTRLLSSAPHFYAVLTAILESLIALALLFGIARKTTYIGGAILSFLIWGIGEGFGGPYAAGSTDISAAIIYCFVFAALYQIDFLGKSKTWALDGWLTKHIGWWPALAEPKTPAKIPKPKASK